MTFHLLVFGLILVSITSARDFYVSSSLGSDSRNITEAQSTATPWKTISKVNSLQSALLPGDQIFFCQGEVFFGQVTDLTPLFNFSVENQLKWKLNTSNRCKQLPLQQFSHWSP